MSLYQTATARRLRRVAVALEVTTLALACVALGYRATLYWTLPAAHGSPYSPALLIDFSLAMLLFAVCLMCAGAGVAISLYGDPQDKQYAYRAFFVGVLSFLAYDLLYPLVPRLL